jgi:hypothetical protein
VPLLTVVQARAAIRSATMHDNDQQTTDAQLDVIIDQEYRRLRRAIATVAPELYQSTASTALTVGQDSIALAADADQVFLVERLVGTSTYYPVPMAERLNASTPSDLRWYQRNASVILAPVEGAAGTYRLTYQTAPATGYTSLDVPAGLEDVIIERCSGWVRQRHDEDPGYHIRRAEEIWKMQKRYLIRNHGPHPVPGLMRARSYWRSW